MKKFIATLLLGLLATAPAVAEKQPQPGPADTRIRTVVYNPRDVVKVIGHYGFQTLIQFATAAAICCLSNRLNKTPRPI